MQQCFAAAPTIGWQAAVVFVCQQVPILMRAAQIFPALHVCKLYVYDSMFSGDILQFKLTTVLQVGCSSECAVHLSVLPVVAVLNPFVRRPGPKNINTQCQEDQNLMSNIPGPVTALHPNL